MENIYIFQIISQIRTLIGAENPQRQRQNCPEMDNLVIAAKMMGEFVYLGMAVVTASDAVSRTTVFNLLILQLSILKPLILETRLQKTTATTTAIIV